MDDPAGTIAEYDADAIRTHSELEPGKHVDAERQGLPLNLMLVPTWNLMANMLTSWPSAELRSKDNHGRSRRF